MKLADCLLDVRIVPVAVLMLAVNIGCEDASIELEKARKVDTLDSYLDYHRRYPHSDEAIRRLEEKLWKSLDDNLLSAHPGHNFSQFPSGVDSG